MEEFIDEYCIDLELSIVEKYTMYNQINLLKQCVSSQGNDSIKKIELEDIIHYLSEHVRKNQKRTNKNKDFNITDLICIIFLLLLIFILVMVLVIPNINIWIILLILLMMIITTSVLCNLNDKYNYNFAGQSFNNITRKKIVKHSKKLLNILSN